jgi:hypothetical protein
MEAQGNVTDRYYRCLYELMIHRDATETRKLSLYFNVLYKALRSDPCQGDEK